MNPKMFHVPHTGERVDIIIPDSVSDYIVRAGMSTFPRHRCFETFSDAQAFAVAESLQCADVWMVRAERFRHMTEPEAQDDGIMDSKTQQVEIEEKLNAMDSAKAEARHGRR